MKKPGADRRERWRTVSGLIHGDHEDRAKPPIKADINVTPLVDVVLVLLIIFMVVTPLIASGVAVDLPRTAHHARKPDDGKDIIVSITKEEKVYVGRNLVRSDRGSRHRADRREASLSGQVDLPQG